MDSSSKPQKDNPRGLANIFSHLFIGWSIPLLYKGSRRGLNTEDLPKCLPDDNSEILGDKLEKQWHKELEKSLSQNREPSLRTALLKTFWPSAVVDGMICFIYMVVRSLVPAVLAQLLLQFQNPLNGITTDAAADSLLTGGEGNASYPHDRRVRAIDVNEGNNINALDAEVKTSTSNPVSPSTNDVEENVMSYFIDLMVYIWNDVYCLGALMIIAIVLSCFLMHHSDLRQQLLGARMRIACCSLIYRKTVNLSMKTAGQTPAGYLINLLSNDVGRLDYGFIYVHWIWILPFQSVLICYLIWRRIGLAAVVGVVALLLKTVPLQTGLSALSSKLRMKIAERTDARVDIMNELIQGIQVIKMYAWEKPFQMVVKETRRREIKQVLYASYLRGFYMSTIVFTERTTLFVTIAAAVLMGNVVSADVVFSLAGYYNIFQLIAGIYYPLAVSLAAEAFTSIQRVQAFLQLEANEEQVSGVTYKNNKESEGNAIVLKNVSANWDSTKPQRALEHVSMTVPKGQLCAVIGAVGAGKSSLIQLVLGELPVAEGDLMVQGDVSYAAQEPWLFTGTVRKNILFGENFYGTRYEKVTQCCALSTDFEQLENGDKTIVGERGASLSGGQKARISLARAIYKPADIYLLDDPLSAVDAHVGRHLFDEVIGPNGCLARENATRILVTHQIHFLSEVDWIVIVENGHVSRQGTYTDLLSSDLDFAKLLERRPSATTATDSASLTRDNEDMPFMDGQQDTNGYQPIRRKSSAMSGSSNKQSDSSGNDDVESKQLVEEQAEGGVSARVWMEYFRAGSTVLSFSFMVFIMLLSQAVCSGTDYFVNIWTQQEYLRATNQTTLFTINQSLYIYGGLIIALVVMTVYRSFLFFDICMQASKTLHDRMFCSIINAAMRFFNQNNSGRILNRFSKDMGIIDELLPKAMIEALLIVLMMFGILVVICVINPILITAILIAAVIDGLILKMYLRPSQDLQRLEGICRSPVFAHMTATLSGIATIRSRNLQATVAKEFDNLQDVHSSVWQLTMSAKTALGLWLDIVCCCFLTAVTFCFIILTRDTYSGNVGLAISQAMVLTGMVQYGVRQVTDSLQQMTSVERILQYTDLEQESSETRVPPTTWPSQGLIEFRNMYCRYDPNSEAVLKNLNLTIEPSWKVGIVGRTGAGKSSLIGALFRLAYIDGDIIIDDIDTGTITLESLRSKISIIPQDPVLFSATIRYNLDPFEKYSDAEIWKALEDVELKGAIPGLEYLVTERGSNFSVGQRQLICLARAVLRNNKVLVLDEATANVDPQTDALIQRTIRDKFKHCTVLTVAHRLQTVMDSDRILVMDSGQAQEFDIPHLLLQKPNGALRQMVEATGTEALLLKQMASKAYQSYETAE